MKEIFIDRKKLTNGIEDVLLKGRYRGASSSKVDMINANVAMLVNSRTGVTIANANHSIATMVTVNINPSLEEERHFEPCWVFCDAEKAIKYLKAMKDNEIMLKITDSKLIFNGVETQLVMPLSIEHSGISAIAKLMVAKVEQQHKGTTAKFGNTTFDTVVLLEDSKDLARAIKECSVVGTSSFKITFDKLNLAVSSSNFQNTETYKTYVDFTGAFGEEVEVEFSAPLDKFCKGRLYLCLKDMAPVLIIGTDRKLIVAPYVRDE